jgi:RimJ/RimL family protein N-acetyltransferase
MNFLVTQGKISDAESMLDLMYSCKDDLDREGLNSFFTLPYWEQFKRIKAMLRGNVFIIKDNGKIIATLSESIIDSRMFDEYWSYETYFYPDHYASFGSFLVAKEYRRKGMAKKLMDHAEKEISKRGIGVIKALINKGNHVSIQVAKDLGFKKIGRGRVLGKYKCLFFEKELI